MAGILDKKTRVLDYILTKEGRSQLKDGGDLRFVYATVSDRGLEYTSKQSVNKLTFEEADQLFTTSSHKISDTERFYLGFEANSTFVDRLNPEYSLIGGVSYPKSTNNTIDEHGLNQFSIEEDFESLSASMTGSFTDKIHALKIIDTFNQIESEEIVLNNVDDLKDVTYNFADFDIDKYPTLVSSNLNLSKEKTLQEDLRFSHKNNFKKLVPVNKDGSQLFSSDSGVDLTNNYEFIFKKYEKGLDIPEGTSRDTTIKRIIKSLESDNGIYKTIFEVTNPTENDIWITQIFETNSTDKKFDKLVAIDLGEFYFEDSGLSKQIFLFGKVYQSSKKGKDTRTSDEHAPVYEKEFILSREYSFVNIFTLVIE